MDALLSVITASYLKLYPETKLLYWSLAVQVIVRVVFNDNAELIAAVEFAVGTPALTGCVTAAFE